MKYSNEYYMQLSRKICQEEYVNKLSIGARMLFVTLNELEQRYCSDKRNYFIRSNEDLAKDMGVSVKTLKRYKQELKTKAPELVTIKKGKYVNNGKLSEITYSAYSILR